MKLLRWHTPEEVARQLIEGLENGTLAVGGEPDVSEVLRETRRVIAETDAILAPLVAELAPDLAAPDPDPAPDPHADLVITSEAHRLQLALENLHEARRINAKAKALAAEMRTARRKSVARRAVVPALFAAYVAGALYLLWGSPINVFSFLVGSALGAILSLVIRVPRAAVENSARLMAAIADLRAQTRSLTRA